MSVKLIAFRLLFSLVAIPNDFSVSVSLIVTPAFCRLFSMRFHTLVAYLHLISRWSIGSISPWQNVHLLSFNIPHLNNVSFVIRVWCKILNWVSRSLVDAVLDKVLRKRLRKSSFDSSISSSDLCFWSALVGKASVSSTILSYINLVTFCLHCISIVNLGVLVMRLSRQEVLNTCLELHITIQNNARTSI